MPTAATAFPNAAAEAVKSCSTFGPNVVMFTTAMYRSGLARPLTKSAAAFSLVCLSETDIAPTSK